MENKTEYLCENANEAGGRLKSRGVEMVRAVEFKYLWSTMHSDGQCARGVRNKVLAGWSGWTKVSEVICDRRKKARVKAQVHETVRPARCMVWRRWHCLKDRRQSWR